MKRVRTWLVALSFLAAAAGWEPPPRSPEGGDKKSPTPATGKRLGRPDVAGVVKAVSADGKTLSVTTQVGEKAGEEESTDLTLTDETRVVFTSVGPGGAGVRKGYFIRAWLAGGKGPATRIHLASTTAAANDAPSLAGVVTAVGEGGRSFAILIAEKTKEDKEEQAILKITAKTGVRFTHVAAGGARLKKGMRAVVWLADGSKEDIERVILYGSAEKFDKDRTTEPAFSGKVALAEEGKSLTVEVPAAKKGEKARRVEIRLGDMTEQVYRNVPEDGAKPKPGYSATVWSAGDSAAAAKKILFVGPADTRRVLMLGRVGAVADDGKSFTLVQAAQTKGEEGTSMTVELTEKARVIFHGVGPGGARPTKGYKARVWLAEGGAGSARVVVFEGGVGGR